MKKIVILAIATLLASSAFADRRSMKERTETWLQNEKTEETSSADLRIGTPPPSPTVPVGTLPTILILLFGGVYCVVRKKKSDLCKNTH
jgi:hypothetical protein